MKFNDYIKGRAASAKVELVRLTVVAFSSGERYTNELLRWKISSRSMQVNQEF